MSRVFFISDLHLGHENMAKYRGFENSEQHDNFIIKNWNEIVHKKDLVWILGDITMESDNHYYLLNKLNGRKKVVLGNHDKPSGTQELLRYVETVSGMVEYKGIVLTHCPIHESEIYRYKKNICGHVHANSLEDKRYINVCCEAINYTPQLLINLLN